MKYEQVSPEVFVEIQDTDTMPIIIEAAGVFINISFEELEKIYEYVKQNNETVTSWEI